MTAESRAEAQDLRDMAVETLAAREHVPEQQVRDMIEEIARDRGLHFLDAAAVLYERRETGYEARPVSRGVSGQPLCTC